MDGSHGVNLYDYAARYMDAAKGRFDTPDPLMEKYYSWSPYVYVANNPLKYIDPTGMSLTDYYTLRNCVYDKIGHYDDGTDNIVVAIQDEVIVEGKMPRNVENQIVGVAGTSGFTADVGKTGGLAIGFLQVIGSGETSSSTTSYNEVSEGEGGLGLSANIAEVTVFTYTGNVNNLELSTFYGKSKSYTLSAYKTFGGSITVSKTHDKYGGVLTGYKVGAGVGMGFTIGAPKCSF